MARPRKYDPSRNESQRVSQYRQAKQKAGYKNIGFLVSPEEYALLERERNRLGMTTKAVLFYYLKKQYHYLYPGSFMEFVEEERPEYDCTIPEGREARLEAEAQLGEIFKIHDCKAYVLASLLVQTEIMPCPFPYVLSVWRDFDRAEVALETYLHKRESFPKSEQMALFVRANQEELGWENPGHWYHLKLLLNQVYPQLMSFYSVSDLTDYSAMYSRIQAAERESDVN